MAEVGRQDWNLTLDIEPSAVGIGEGVDGEEFFQALAREEKQRERKHKRA